jgi:prolyl-tRNA synthetase
MNRIGGQEILLPVLQPAEAWRKSGRYAIPEVFHLKDRKSADMVLAMTHEEAITTHMAQLVRSYRDLPQILYQFQIKERDEPRPRAGLLRTREFVMKDSYSFDCDEEGLAVAYDKHVQAYDRIFDRCGLEWYRVEADVGMMGGKRAHEYMAPCGAGENEVVLAGDYCANREIASAQPQPVELPASISTPQEIETPGLTTVEQVSAEIGVAPGALLKAYPIVGEDDGLMMVLLRGDHRINDIKLRNAIGQEFRPAKSDEIEAKLGPVGYIGPLAVDVPILLDEAATEASFVTGANKPDKHLQGVEPGRDFQCTHVDVRQVEAGDTVDGVAVTIEPAIEVANIFALGTRYSEPLDATFLDEKGNAQAIWMGSYGIGPARIVASAVEQNADEQGIVWPQALAPFDVELVGLGAAGSSEYELAERLYADLEKTDLSVLYDDRDRGVGEKFADAELLGASLRITVGKRTLKQGKLEVQVRRGMDNRLVDLEGAVESIVELCRALVP